MLTFSRNKWQFYDTVSNLDGQLVDYNHSYLLASLEVDSFPSSSEFFGKKFNLAPSLEKSWTLYWGGRGRDGKGLPMIECPGVRKSSSPVVTVSSQISGRLYNIMNLYTWIRISSLSNWISRDPSSYQMEQAWYEKQRPPRLPAERVQMLFSQWVTRVIANESNLIATSVHNWACS